MSEAIPPFVVSKNSALTSYSWGSNCKAWVLVDTEDPSVKHELMPPGTEEELHYHKTAQQFFHVVKGRVVFEVEDIIIIVHSGEGIHIEAGKKHRIMNKEDEDLEFLVCSQPSTAGDRYNLI